MENNPEEKEATGTEETVETEAETEETAETEGKEESTSQFDYEAELEAEKKRGPDPEKAREAFLERKRKREGEVEKEEAPEDKPMTRAEMEAFFEERTQRLQKDQNADRIREFASEMADSDAEASLIVEIHKNRTFPQGLSLKEQVEEAWAIANRKRLAAKNVELARALQGKAGVNTDAASTHRDPQEGTAPKVAPDLKASLKRSGFSYNGKERRFEKKLPNGKLLIKDTPTSQPRVV